jgi:hypothetical protein
MVDGGKTLKKSLSEFLEENVKPLEGRLKVKSGFFADLLEEKNDWSFIIKLHSLVEAAISHYLSVKLNNNKLESVFQRIPLSALNGGKIDFLKALDLLNEQRGFIVLLSVIRNDYVHVVANVGLRFEEYFDSNKQNFKTLVNAYFKKFPSKSPKPLVEKFVKKMPGLTIWLLTMILLMEAYEGIRPSKAVPIF